MKHNSDDDFLEIKERYVDKAFKKHMQKYYTYKIGQQNPVTTKTEMIGGIMLQVHCPSCPYFYCVPREEINPDTGEIVQCKCENLTYVPGGYNAKVIPKNLQITGGVLVPVNEMRQWYLNHPLVKKWFQEGKKKNILDYPGLFAYCSECYYQFGPSQIKTMVGIKPRERLYCCRNMSPIGNKNLILILVEKGSPAALTFPHTVMIGL